MKKAEEKGIQQEVRGVKPWRRRRQRGGKDEESGKSGGEQLREESGKEKGSAQKVKRGRIGVEGGRKKE